MVLLHSGKARRGDNGDEEFNRDIVKTSEGRYIGGVRDKSAPTEDWVMVSMS